MAGDGGRCTHEGFEKVFKGEVAHPLLAAFGLLIDGAKAGVDEAQGPFSLLVCLVEEVEVFEQQHPVINCHQLCIWWLEIWKVRIDLCGTRRRESRREGAARVEGKAVGKAEARRRVGARKVT